MNTTQTSLTHRRSVEELCAPGHARHMARIKQDKWLTDILAKANQRQWADEERQAADLAAYRETGQWPQPSLAKHDAGQPSAKKVPAKKIAPKPTPPKQ